MKRTVFVSQDGVGLDKKPRKINAMRCLKLFCLFGPLTNRRHIARSLIGVSDICRRLGKSVKCVTLLQLLGHLLLHLLHGVAGEEFAVQSPIVVALENRSKHSNRSVIIPTHVHAKGGIIIEWVKSLCDLALWQAFFHVAPINKQYAQRATGSRTPGIELFGAPQVALGALPIQIGYPLGSRYCDT